VVIAMETPRKQKRLEELLLTLRSAAEEEPAPSVEVLERALEAVDEAVALRPDDFSIAAYARAIGRRLSRAKAVTQKLQQARGDAKRGWLDEAVREAESASKIDPANSEASQYAEKLKSEREQILTILEQAKALIDASEFTAARKKLFIARDLNGAYPPVQEMNCLLADKRREHDEQVSNRLDEICAANERKEFDRVLELAETLRSSTKLSGRAAEQLKQQELRARTFGAEKEKKRQAFKDAREKLQACDYTSALKAFDEGFENANNVWKEEDHDRADAVKYREEALRKQKRLEELLLTLHSAAEEEPAPSVEALERALEAVDEAVTLRPDDPAVAAYARGIAQRLNRAKEDSVRTMEAQESPQASPTEENACVSTESPNLTSAEPQREACEEQKQTDHATRTEEPPFTSGDMSEPEQRDHAGELQVTSAPSDRHEDPAQLSRELQEAEDQLIREAESERRFEEIRNKFAQGLENYRENLQRYSPPDVSILNQAIDTVESEEQDRMVGKCLGDAEELERDGRIIEALVLYQRTHVSMPPEGRLQLEAKIEALTRCINTVKILRATGEVQETQGQIADAIESYKQSLELVPDANLEEHVAALEDSLASVRDEDVAECPSDEGAPLEQPDLPGDAPANVKEPDSQSSGPAPEETGLDLKATLVTRGRRDETIKFRQETFAHKIRR
jgi:hypothetical protein